MSPSPGMTAKTYQTNFKVEFTVDKDVEVLAK